MSILSWYLGDLRDPVRIELSQQLSRVSDEDMRIKISLCLHSKVAALEVLRKSFHERDFFGNLLPEMKKLLSGLRVVQYDPNRPKRRIRRRGYRDHGTLRPLHEQHSAKYDWSFTTEQLQIEEDRKVEADTIAFLHGLLM